MQGEKISITVTPNYNDYKAFFRFHYKTRQKGIRTALTIIAIIIALIGIYVFGTTNQVVGVIMLWAALMLTVYPRNMYRTSARRMKKSDPVTSHISFYDDEMSENRAAKKKTYKYSELHKVYETKSYYYIYYTPDNAAVIPKCNFFSEADCAAVKRLLGIERVSR